jgi:hypothetical protein
MFFPDSWRRERSQLYQKATQRAIKRALRREEDDQRKLVKQRQKDVGSGLQTPANTTTLRSGTDTPVTLNSHDRTAAHSHTPDSRVEVEGAPILDVEADLSNKEVIVRPRARSWKPWSKKSRDSGSEGADEEHVKIKLTLSDVNPAPAMWAILKRPNNLLSVSCSGTV